MSDSISIAVPPSRKRKTPHDTTTSHGEIAEQVVSSFHLNLSSGTGSDATAAPRAPAHPHTDRRRREENAARLARRYEAISTQLSAVDATRLFGMNISIDPRLQSTVAKNWMRPLSTSTDTPVHNMVAQLFVRILASDVQLEIETIQQAPGQFTARIYLFGIAEQFLVIPLEYFRCSFSAHAALARLRNEPSRMPAGCEFLDTSFDTHMSKITARQFRHNAALSVVLSRFSFLCSWCITWAAAARVMEVRAHTKPVTAAAAATAAATATTTTTAGGETSSSPPPPSDDYVSKMRRIVLSALCDVVERLNKPEVKREKPWVTAQLICDIYALIELCKSNETFWSENLSELFLEAATRHCKMHTLVEIK
jgi:hypothetical protein